MKLVLPSDVLVADRVEAGASRRIVPPAQVPPDMAIVDIGPRTVEAFGAEIDLAGTVLWNGPLGVFEIPDFGTSTKAIAERLARSSAVAVIGGGESDQLGQACQLVAGRSPPRAVRGSQPRPESNRQQTPGQRGLPRNGGASFGRLTRPPRPSSPVVAPLVKVATFAADSQTSLPPVA